MVAPASVQFENFGYALVSFWFLCHSGVSLEVKWCLYCRLTLKPWLCIFVFVFLNDCIFTNFILSYLLLFFTFCLVNTHLQQCGSITGAGLKTGSGQKKERGGERGRRGRRKQEGKKGGGETGI